MATQSGGILMIINSISIIDIFRIETRIARLDVLHYRWKAVVKGLTTSKRLVFVLKLWFFQSFRVAFMSKVLIEWLFQDLSLWTKFRLPLLGEIRFNPVVTGLAVVVIWGFVIWSCVEGKRVPFPGWKTWSIDHFTWLYIGSVDVWLLFVIFLYFR